MAAEASKLVTKVRLRKWDEVHTANTAQYHGIDPDELTAEHFDALGIAANEELHIDHEAQTVKLIHNSTSGAYGDVQTFSFEEWHNRGN